MKLKTRLHLTLSVLTILTGVLAAQTADNQTTSQPTSAQVNALRSQLAEQQKQIDQLKLALEDQKKLIEQFAKPATVDEKRDFALPRNKALGEVASTTPIIPAAAAALPSAAALPASTRRNRPRARPPIRARRIRKAPLLPSFGWAAPAWSRSASWTPRQCGATRTPLRVSGRISEACLITTS
jgi:ABC-type transporter Mla subunit MlaD